MTRQQASDLVNAYDHLAREHERMVALNRYTSRGTAKMARCIVSLDGHDIVVWLPLAAVQQQIAADIAAAERRVRQCGGTPT